jgi:hypothetical protein
VLKGATLTTDIEIIKPTPMNMNPTSTNTFVATPKNNGVPIVDGQLKATFRIANWGTTAGLPPADDSLWKTVGPGAVNSGAIAGGGTPVDLKNVWSAPANDPIVAKYLSGELGTHQCVLVELTATQGDLFFVNRSVYRNMNFVKASKVGEKAIVNVAGLPPVEPGAKTRTVYLYVHTVAMPPVIDRPTPPPAPWPNPLPKPNNRSVPVSAKQGPPKDPEPRIGVAAAVNGRERRGIDDVAIERGRETNPERLTTPTYTVYAWHDTGKTLRLNGVVMRIVEPQTSFGYYVSHEGPLYGWQYALKGAEKIGPDFYKVAPPVGGSVDVFTEVEALEHGPGSPGSDVFPYCPPGYVPIVRPQYERPRLIRRWR